MSQHLPDPWVLLVQSLTRPGRYFTYGRFDEKEMGEAMRKHFPNWDMQVMRLSTAQAFLRVSGLDTGGRME